MREIHPVILCGGDGSRLWPRSRPQRPKPFLKLFGDRTLFQQCLDRLGNGEIFARPTIVCGAAHVALVAQQAANRSFELIVEPERRDTAPAIASAALSLPPDTVMLVCPSDHHIADREAFERGVIAAAGLAQENRLVAFGIRPNTAETRFGYVEKGKPLGHGSRVERFVEKPDEDIARSMIQSGKYLWNCGIFAFKAGVFLDELERLRPSMAKLVGQAMGEARIDGYRTELAPDPYGAIDAESVDYAVMENAREMAMVEVSMGWSDIGTWNAVMDTRSLDRNGNAIRGQASLVDCRNVMVDTDGPRITVQGLDDVIVVVDGDEILVSKREAGEQRPGPSSIA